jgi:two-component system chemotaxis sensor kinase CheA
VRLAAGKPAVGTVRLSAAHEEGQIVITVSDDGAGIDSARVKQSAIDKGLITADEARSMSEEEAINLIFRPTLSTAEQVTEVSGRGMGMDVVLTSVQRLSGSVVVDSALGEGSTVRITLPLTLAIVQTMLVGLGDDVYAVPLTSIIESLYERDVAISTIKGSPVIRWRNETLPILDMNAFYVNPRRAPAPGNSRRAIITVTWGKLRAGLLVDRIIGKQEIVIKSLGALFGQAAGLSGCTILGDGRIALIVDVPGLINAAIQAKRQEAK